MQNEILNYIAKKGQTTIKDLLEIFPIQRRMIHYHIKNLLDNNLIIKMGKTPYVFYAINQPTNVEITSIKCTKKEEKVIEENFLYINTIGKKFYGIDGFIKWCTDRDFDIEKKAKEYLNCFTENKKYQKQGFFDGYTKMQNTFKDHYIDEIWYIDLYAIPIFGKTKLGQLLLYAKQSQNIDIINEVIEIVKPKIEQLIKLKKIDAVGFVPPSIKRNIQFMHILKNKLHLPLPLIDIKKIQTDIVRPQKTLSKLQERIENAEKTMFLSNIPKYKNILLIDDAVGSGATFHELGKKIKSQSNTNQKVIAVSITGSIKGFDIINEV